MNEVMTELTADELEMVEGGATASDSSREETSTTEPPKLGVFVWKT